MPNLKDKVEFCLKKHPQTANSDILLMRAVWHEFHNSKIWAHNGRTAIYTEDLMDLPRHDEIGRIRRKFNEKGMYLPTDEEVIKQRRKNEKFWHDQMSESNPSLG